MASATLSWCRVQDQPTRIEETAAFPNQYWPRNLSWCRVQDQPTRIEETAALLNQYWPRNLRWRVRWLQQTNGRQDYPISYIVIDKKEDMVVAHARLTSEVVSYDGSEEKSKVSAIATSILVKSTYRGKGIGSMVLKSLEQEAFQAGFGRIVLWTTDASKFYESNGYLRCRPLKVAPAVLNSHLSTVSVDLLENMLVRKNQSIRTVEGDLNHCLGYYDVADRKQNCIYFSKRVREHFDQFQLEKIDIIKMLEREIIFSDSTRRNGEHFLFSGKMLHCPNETQIGPMCGISALHCVCKYLTKPLDGIPVQCTAEKFLEALPTAYRGVIMKAKLEMESILSVARARRFTYDGEIFDCGHLGLLATACGLDAVQCRMLDINIIYQAISHNIPLLVCVDKEPTGGIGFFRGIHAHWAIVVGIVVKEKIIEKDADKFLIHWEGNLSTSTSTFLIPKGNDACSHFVILQHTLSHKLLVVPIDRLVRSNAQLHEETMVTKKQEVFNSLSDRHKREWCGIFSPNIAGQCLLCFKTS